jgi:tetratricopeptide (TPR) repeat protein
LRAELAVNPDYAKAILSLGILSYEIGKYSDGGDYIWRAAEKEPRYNMPIFREAMAAHEKGDRRRALALFQELAATNVDDISFHFGVGKKLYRSGHYSRAVESFEQALSLQSNYPDIRNWLGLALMATGQNERAFEQFQQALETNPNYVAATINAGVVCQMMGLSKDAAEHYRRALETHPENLEARERLSKLQS